MSETRTESVTVVAARLEDWRRRLIDLSNRNRLIAFRPTQATTLQIAAPSLDELLGDPSGSQVWSFYFPPELDTPPPSDDQSDAATTVDEAVLRAQGHVGGRRQGEIEVTERNPKRIARILDNLAKRSNSEFQDKALRILYLAAGFLDWHDLQRDKAISSPLVLVPVELRRESTRDPYRLFFVDDEEIVINPSLTEKLRRDAGLDVPGDWVWEDKPIAQELDEIRRAVSGTGWTVREDAVLGLFSFQKYVMYRDLLDHEDRVSAHPVVRSLAHGHLLAELRDADPDVPEPHELDDAQPPQRTLSILDSDASQRQCVEASKRGRSFVMQGPPGTGKSQTIANVIAEAIGQGKRVLFVSEKAAALDVVFRRLAASGLDEYCLMLHGEHAGRREVVQTLDRALNTALRPRPAMRSDDLDRLENLRTLLNTSAELLHLPQPILGDRTLREVHEQLASLHEAASVPGAPDPKPLTGRAVLDEYLALSEIFQRLSERWKVSPSDFIWRGYDAADTFTANQHGQAGAALRHLKTSHEDLAHTAMEIAEEIAWPNPRSLIAARRLAELGEHLQVAPLLEPVWIELDAQELMRAADQASSAYAAEADLRAAFDEALPARQLNHFPTDIQDRLRAAVDAVTRECGWADSWNHSLADLGGALRSLADLPELINALSSRAEAAARIAGQPATSLTKQRIEQLADLANLCFTANPRPEARWLVQAGLQRATATLDDLADDLNTYQQNRSELFASYTETALDLPAADLASRFQTSYTSWFSKFSGSYRQDAKAIKAARKDAKLPQNPADDLAAIAALQDLGARIDARADTAQQALGGFHRGRDTDVDQTRDAIAVARRVHELSRPDADLTQLAAAIAVGASPDPGAAQAADQLREADRAMRQALPALMSFIARGPDADDVPLTDLQGFLEAITPAVQQLAVQIADLDRGAAKPAQTIDETSQRAATISALHDAVDAISAQSPAWTTLLGRFFDGPRTEWASVRHAANWLGQLHQLAPTELPARVQDQLRATDRSWPAFERLATACDSARQAGEELTALFEPQRASELEAFLSNARFEDVAALRTELEAHIDELHDWTEWRRWRDQAQQQGWGLFLDALIDADVPEVDVVAVFQRAYWNRQLEALYADEPELADDLRGGAFQRWVEDFSALDRALVRTGTDRLIAARERARTTHVATPGSEVELLRREARKKIRHLPVRVLLSRIPTLLSELKPCLMMSPLTVSHFLAPDHTFDLVVFDEASQVPPWDAINCIYRGRQLIVAGDSKQLPPTPFFQVAELDELSPDDEERSTQEDMESILDSCESLLPVHPLRWHYRSRAEPLIAFSNHYIYDNNLVTFPSADEQSQSKGVSFTYVPDGVYDRGKTATNRREAQVVAQRVMEHLLERTGSVGVIAFNAAQATAISEELDLLKMRHPALEEHFRGTRLDAVFVKHLEAVQGDERDVIVFSVGYGPDAEGKFTMNFGPLNKDGGQRRLNVAVTRARERVELVASVRSHDFQLSENASAGARLLRDYIAYAENNGRLAADPSSETQDDAVDWPTPLEQEIAAVIEELGYRAVPSVGAGSFRIDIGVRSHEFPDRYILGIETDSDGYAQTPTARDRERLRHEVLDALGWGTVHRIWSLDWVRNRHAEVHRLSEALTAASQRARSQPQTLAASTPASPVQEPEIRERVERNVVELNTSASANELPWTETYRRAVLGRAHSVYEFHESVNRREQTDLLVRLLEIEAPISVDYAIRRLAGAYGLQRAGHRVVTAARQAIGQAGRRGAANARGDFLWRPGQTLTKVRIPDPDDPETRRDIDDIPPEEIDLAIARLRETSAGINDEQLITHVARILGFDRTGDRIRTTLAQRLQSHGGPMSSAG
jgi:hypothetical protein